MDSDANGFQRRSARQDRGRAQSVKPVTDRTTQFAGSGHVRPGQELDSPRLSAWLRSHVPEYSAPLTILQFKGGQSNPTYLLRTPVRDYVLRRKPPGQLLKGAHAIEREFRAISALGGIGFPVAQAFAYCSDPGVIGTEFYVMEMVEGRIFWDPTLPGIGRDERSALFDAMNSTIAALHGVDPVGIGLGDYAKAGNYFQRQIGRWSRQYLEDEAAGRNVDMDRLVEWLPAHIPAGDDSRVVHGDFRADNLIFHATEPKVVAVIDWELSTLGHPLADFAYHLMMYRVPPEIVGGIGGYDLAALGIPSEADYRASYCSRTGRPPIEDLEFYLAFNMFRLAAILHGIKGRIARGTASSAHARSMAAQVEPLAALAWKQIENI
jgi:aminoglycoside phosphotransferase (APT) family kinase protein